MCKGFTLMELIIVLGIIVILAAATIPIYANFQLSVQLNENSDFIVQALRMARERSAARYNDSAHGVRFFSDNFILYQGSSYATRQSDYDQVNTLPSTLTISTTFSGDEINFAKGTGMPNGTGTATLTHSIRGEKTISVNSLGMVEE